MDMAKFYTRNKANAGVLVLLELPDGTKTDKWLKVVGQDSDLYLAGYAETTKKAIAASQAPAADKIRLEAEFHREQKRAIEACVTEWNLDEPLTPDNVATLLDEAPQIRKLVEGAVYDRKRFFSESSAN